MLEYLVMEYEIKKTVIERHLPVIHFEHACVKKATPGYRFALSMPSTVEYVSTVDIEAALQARGYDLSLTASVIENPAPRCQRRRSLKRESPVWGKIR